MQKLGGPVGHRGRARHHAQHSEEARKWTRQEPPKLAPWDEPRVHAVRHDGASGRFQATGQLRGEQYVRELGVGVGPHPGVPVGGKWALQVELRPAVGVRGRGDDAGALLQVIVQLGGQQVGGEGVDVGCALDAVSDEAALAEQPAGVVEQQVEPVGLRPDRMCQAAHLGGIGEIRRQDDRFGAVASNRLRDLFPGVSVAAMHHDRRPKPSERLGRCAPDAIRRAGDEGHRSCAIDVRDVGESFWTCAH